MIVETGFLTRAEDLDSCGEFFKVLTTSERSQAAVMTLQSGQTSGDFGTEHPESDQWLYVISGAGTIRIEDQRITLKTGDLVLIPAGAKHQVTGGYLKSLNFYSPAVEQYR